MLNVVGSPAAIIYFGNPKVGKLMKDRVFGPGASLPRPEFVTYSTGEPLSPRAFAAQLVGSVATPLATK